MFIDQKFSQQFPIKTLDHPLKAFNVDGTKNKTGTIRSYVDLEFAVNQQKFTEHLYVTGLGKQKIILGFPWLNKHNPKIDWKTGKMEWKKFVFPKNFFLNLMKKFDNELKPKLILEDKPKDIAEEPKPSPRATIEEIHDKDEDKSNMTNILEEEKTSILAELKNEAWINKMNVATELAIKENKKGEKTNEELVPKEYHEYLDVFSEEKLPNSLK